MKKIVLGFLVLCSWTSVVMAGQRWNDKPFFSPKSQGLNTAMELAVWNKGVVNGEDSGIGANLAVTPFYEHSTNGYAIGRYFLYNGLDSLKFASPSIDSTTNVNPQNFDLPADFQGKFSIRPNQLSAGARVDFYHNLGRYAKGLYWSVGMPVVYVKNNPHFVEEITDSGTLGATGPRSIEQAFSGEVAFTSDWRDNFEHSKIDGSRHKTEIAELDFKLGIRFLDSEVYHLGVNVCVLAPTGNEPRGDYMWEAIAGNGGHIGVGGGLDGWYLGWQHEEKNRFLDFSSHQRLIYLFEDVQSRTLQIKRQWGRFIRMRRQDPNDATKVLAGAVPGVNALTRHVKVTPGLEYDITAAMHAHVDSWLITVGYEGWFRQQEKLRLKDAFTRSGVYGLSSNNGTLLAEPAGVAVSSSTTIKTFAPGDGIFLTESDVEESGHPPAQSHKLFSTVQYEWGTKTPVFALIGGSYQVPIKDSDLEKWALWATVGVSF